LSEKPVPRDRDAYSHFTLLDTRWMDNDVYGHVNNVQYYSFFDTAVNRHLIEAGVLDPRTSAVIGLVVETRCSYLAQIAFPDRLQVGMKVLALGRSSVRYELGLFRNDEAQTAAIGDFVHVYVDRATQRPVPIPDAVRDLLAPLLVPA
jgi:acyl-CoA thioester hydrolase